MKPKKIAILCNYELLPNRVGGMDYFFWQFDKKCKQNNIQIDWFFPNEASFGNYKELNNINTSNQNVEVFFVKYCESSTQNYDFVFTHFVELCTSNFKKIKTITNARIIAVDHNPRPINGYSFKKKLVKKVKGFLYSKYIDLFVGVSHYTVKEIIKDFGNIVKPKTITIYNGVTIDKIKERTNRDFRNPKFLVASHLRESKGIQDLINSVGLLSLKLKNQIKIDIYGDGLYKEILINLINEKKLENCFNFLGSKSNLNEIFCNYDYMLQPTHMECFSLSILESLAANVPVITTNVGGNEEVITHLENGIIFRAKSTDELAKILKEILLQEIKIVKNTRIYIENNFSLENMVNNYLTLLR